MITRNGGRTSAVWRPCDAFGTSLVRPRCRTPVRLGGDRLLAPAAGSALAASALSMRRSAAHIPPSAILLIVGAVACFALLDAIVKYLTARYPVPLLVWARYAVQALAIAALAAPTMRQRGSCARASRRLQLARGAVLLALVAVLLQRAQVPAARRGDGDQLHDADARDPARGRRAQGADDAAALGVRRRRDGRHAADRAAGHRDLPGRGAARARRRGVLRGVPDPDAQARGRGSARHAVLSRARAARC